MIESAAARHPLTAAPGNFVFYPPCARVHIERDALGVIRSCIGALSSWEDSSFRIIRALPLELFPLTAECECVGLIDWSDNRNYR